VFVDDGADCGVPVEGWAANLCPLGDGGEGDGLASCCQFDAGLLDAVEVPGLGHPAWALPMR
jgi:hypothetical protein